MSNRVEARSSKFEVRNYVIIDSVLLSIRLAKIISETTALALLIILALPAGVLASPSSKRSQLSTLKDQVDTINQQIEAVDEEFLQAKMKLNKTTAKINSNEIALSKSKAKLNYSRGVLSKRIRTMYKNGEQSAFQYVFETKSFSELVTNMAYIGHIGKSDTHLIKKVFKLTKEMEQNKRHLEENLHTQKSLVAQVGRKKQAIKSEIDRKNRLIKGLESDLAAYARAQEQREIEESARRIQEQQSSPLPINDPAPIPTIAPKSSVVNIAMRYLGRPYQWAAAGPDRFDCSGLTMYVYAQVGISLPHSSQAQSGMGQYVSRDQLQPGDLVFSGSPIHHVGIYIGGGSMINAPQTGDVVKISPLRGNFRWGRRV